MYLLILIAIIYILFIFFIIAALLIWRKLQTAENSICGITERINLLHELTKSLLPKLKNSIETMTPPVAAARTSILKEDQNTSSTFSVNTPNPNVENESIVVHQILPQCSSNSRRTNSETPFPFFTELHVLEKSSSNMPITKTTTSTTATTSTPIKNRVIELTDDVLGAENHINVDKIEPHEISDQMIIDDVTESERPETADGSEKDRITTETQKSTDVLLENQNGSEKAPHSELNLSENIVVDIVTPTVLNEDVSQVSDVTDTGIDDCTYLFEKHLLTPLKVVELRSLAVDNNITLYKPDGNLKPRAMLIKELLELKSNV